MHPRNRHLSKSGQLYDLAALSKTNPALKKWLVTKANGQTSVDFSQAQAVKELNRALLFHFYNVQYWQFPDEHLCPPIPGRVDYIHYLADLLSQSNGAAINKGKAIRGLDIGTGATLIYPILASAEYDWTMVASDISKSAINNCETIIKQNPRLLEQISVLHQGQRNLMFSGIIQTDERFHFTMCNPPFFKSAQEAVAANSTKQKNLKGSKKTNFNFSGTDQELWCRGGEFKFIKQMINESAQFKENVLWFTSLVSDRKNMSGLKKQLIKAEVAEYKVVEMGQGNKRSRFIAWSFIPENQRSGWFSD